MLERLRACGLLQERISVLGLRLKISFFDIKSSVMLVISMKNDPDKSLIQRNLQLSPEERIKNHQGALEFLLNLKKAGKSHSDKSQRTIKKTP